MAATIFNGRGLLAFQVDALSGPGVRLHAGAEYQIQPSIALRVGYDDRYAAGGFSYRTNGPMQIDYALADQPLGMSHRVGLSYRFGGFFASSKAPNSPVHSSLYPCGKGTFCPIRACASATVEPRSRPRTLYLSGTKR